MFADLGYRVIAADLDPQASLTTSFFEEAYLEEFWSGDKHPNTVFGSIQPLIQETGDITQPHIELIEHGSYRVDLFGSSIGLLIGDLLLSSLEDEFSDAWLRCLDGNPQAFRVVSVFWRMLQAAATTHQADFVLMDLGPNLGAINRAALIAADYIVVPLVPDVFSLPCLHTLGPALSKWRSGWHERLLKNTIADAPLPTGGIQPIGYIVLQPLAYVSRPVKNWSAYLPAEYQKYVLGQVVGDKITELAQDPYCLASPKPYHLLLPLVQEARKPMFHLKPADGALGGHMRATQSAYRDYEQLALAIAKQAGIPTR